MRDWAWAWGGHSLGPVLLPVYVERTAAQLEAWLASHGPLPYARAPGADFLSINQELGEGRLYVREGRIVFMRSRLGVSELVQQADARLCDAMARGELGLTFWDVLEQDYGTYCATGDDCASLAKYLDPASDETELRATWLRALAEKKINLCGNGAPDALAAAFAAALGMNEIHGAAELTNAMARMPLDGQPRVFEVQLEKDVYEKPEVKLFLDALVLSRPRTKWAFPLR